ncbi:tyrosine-type recombinase/integrase [Paracoccaceae bacterium GXU_MW_L88]
MSVVNDRGRFYWVKRVPKRYCGVVVGKCGQPVSQIRLALHTADRQAAKLKAAQIEAIMLADWEDALGCGLSLNACDAEIARRIAENPACIYAPANLLRFRNEGPSEEAVHTGAVEALDADAPSSQKETSNAPDLFAVLDDYFELTRTRHLKKSAPQLKRWKERRHRAVRQFLEATQSAKQHGKLVAPRIDEITRDDAITFRNWWSKRIEDGAAFDTANKSIGTMSEIFKTWGELRAPHLINPFANLRLKGADEGRRPAFSRDWIETRLLAPGALYRLNAEARDILLVMINTGLRPSEITEAPVSDFEVNEEIPFLRVAPHGRELKVAHTKREIPLLGISLAAAKRIVARCGIQRYCNRTDSWSALVNKYLREHELRETAAHSAYSLRHYVEDALLSAGVDDRIRADILGHKYQRPRCGTGGALEGRRAALERIAF